VGGIAVSWNFEDGYVETCSCELMFPCNLSMDDGATYGFCRVTVVYDIREGQIEGTGSGGLAVALIVDTPGVMTEGNWRRGVFVDDGASDEQAERLGQVFRGQLGGPVAGLISDIVPFGVEPGEPVWFNGMFHPVGSDLTMAEAKRSQINGFGIEFEGKSGLSESEFSCAA
jgi:hypothetical protein